MKMIAFALSALLLSSAAGAQIGSTSSSSAPEPTVTSQRHEAGESRRGGDREERRICRRIQMTGTRNGHSVCLTARQWREYDRS